MRLAVAFLLVAVLSVAQTGNGRVQGTVLDTTGALILAADVELVHISTGQSWTTKSNESGLWMFPSAPTGEYTVVVKSAGFAEWKGKLLLQAGQTAAVQATLSPASAASAVTVVAEAAPIVAVDSGNLGSILERQRVDQLPLNGRQIQNLVNTTTAGFEQPGNWGLVNGSRAGSLEYMQDGASITNREQGQPGARPPGLDSINEVRVETNASSARFDRPATVILTTRSGTNQWHGAVFETARNNGLGIARRRQEFFDRPPQLIRNEFGASIGGPVRVPKLYNGTNKTFFFAAWEALRQRQATITGTSVPTAAMRQGDFSGLINAAGQRITLYDPWTTDSRWNRQAFPNNQIPLARRSPVAAYLYDLTPLPTLPDVNPLIANNFFGPSSTKTDTDTGTVRVDHRLSEKDSIFGRYTQGRNDSLARRNSASNGSPILLNNAGNIDAGPLTNRGGVLNWTHTFGPAFFVESLVSANTEEAGGPGLLDGGPGGNVTDKMGLPNPFNSVGLPDVTNTGLGMVYQGTRASINPSRTRILIADQNYSSIIGSHSLEFGWRYRRESVKLIPDVGVNRATFNFASLATGLYDPASGQQANAVPRTGHDTANLFLGVPATYSAAFAPLRMDWRASVFAGYLQDQWKLGRRLTLNVGLRYEYYTPMTEADGQMASFDPASRRIVTSAPINDLVRVRGTLPSVVKSYEAAGVRFAKASEVGLPNALVKSSKLDFSPRIGFAWQIGSGRTTVMRGGYGVYRFPLSIRTFVNHNRQMPPFQANFQRNFNNAAQTPDGLPNFGLRSVPEFVAGVNTARVLTTDNLPDVAPGAFNVNYPDPDQPTSRTHQWNLTIEREFMQNTVARISYVGTHGSALDYWLSENGQATNYVWFVTAGQPVPTGRLANTARRVYDQATYGNINRFTKLGYSNFNSLQAEVQRRYSSGMAFQFFYVLSNAFRTQGTDNTGPMEGPLEDPRVYLAGTVPQDLGARIRLFNYMRDSAVPQHRLRWNWVVDLPFGKGKPLLGNARGILQSLVGGWQLAGGGNGRSSWFDLPTTNWGTIGDPQVYGRQYPIEDCRGGECVKGYLWYNGYIPANRIDSKDAQGRPNGVIGLPSTYKPSHAPIYPIPAAGAAPNDPNATLYETNLALVPLRNGTTQRVAFDTGLHPWRNMVLPGPWNFGLDASLFKTIVLTESVRLRFNADFFSVLNNPGTPAPSSDAGIISLRTSANAPRQLQLTLRVIW